MKKKKVKYRLKKQVRDFLYKAGISFVCLFMVFSLVDLSNAKGLFAADTDANIEFNSSIQGSIDAQDGANEINIQSGKTFYVRINYSVNSSNDEEYTGGTLQIQLPEKAEFDEAMTREMMETTIFKSVTYSETLRLLKFTTDGNFSKSSGTLFVAVHYPNMFTENNYAGNFENINFSYSDLAGHSDTISMSALKATNIANQEWSISKKIVQQEQGKDYVLKDGNYQIKYELDVDPGVADRVGRLDCSEFILEDILPTKATATTNKIANGYPEDGGANAVKIIANENQAHERLLVEGKDYTLVKNSDGSIAKIQFNKNAMNISANGENGDFSYIPNGSMIGTSFSVYADFDYDAYEIPFNEKDLLEAFQLNNNLSLTYTPLKEAQVVKTTNADTKLGWSQDNPETYALNIQKQMEVISLDGKSGNQTTEIKDFDADLQKAYLKDGNTITFGLYKDKDGKTRAKDKDGNTVDGQIITNEGKLQNGKISFSNLLAGTYYVKETTNFVGFQTPVTKKITISKTGEISFDGEAIDKDAPISFVNKASQDGFGYVAFWKKGTSSTSAEPNQYLKGVPFQLISKKDNTLTYEAVSDENGLVFFQGVLQGDYELKELDRGDQEFEKPKDEWKVSVEAKKVSTPVLISNAQLPVDNGKPYITNRSTKGSVLIKKVDADDTTKILTGAEFIAYGPFDTEEKAENADTSTAQATNISSKFTDGIQHFALKAGYYKFIESKAPKGYALNSKGIVKEIKSNTTTNLQITNTKMAFITVKKTGSLTNDSGKLALGGAKFTVYTDESCNNIAQDLTDADHPKDAIIETFDNGTSSKVQLPIGTYYIKETTTPKGFQVNSDVESIALTKGGETVIFERNNIAKDLGRIKITKQSAASSQVKLNNVTFNIKNDKGNIVDTITTGNDGTATTKFLPVGIYTLEEVTQPEGYASNSKGRVFNVVVDGKAGNETNPTANNIEVKNQTLLEITVENEPLVSYKIKKTETDQKTAIAGVKFNLYKTKENANSNKNAIGTFTTDNNGEIEFKNLEPNTKYFFKEIKTASDEYILDTEVKAFTSPGSNDNYQQNGDFIIKNQKYGYFEVVKTLKGFDYEPDSKLPGITFSYYPKKSNDATIDKPQNVDDIYTATTDDNGYFKSVRLEPGDYWLVEEDNSNYVKKEPISITVKSGITVKQDVENTTSYGKLKVKKISSLKDQNNQDVVVANAKFEVYKYKEGNTTLDQYQENVKNDKDSFIGSYITGNDGTFTINSIPEGDYAVIEVQPDNMENYTPNIGKIQKVTIKNNKTNTTLVSTPIENTPRGRFYLSKEEVWGKGLPNEVQFKQEITFGIYSNQNCNKDALVTTMTSSSTEPATLSPYLDAKESGTTYWVKEQLTPEQKEIYGDNQQPKEITVYPGENFDGDIYSTSAKGEGSTKNNPLKFENIPLKGKIQIEKVDQDNKDLHLNGAEFEVYIASDAPKEGYSQYTIDGTTVYLKLYDTTKAITGTADINGDGTKDDGYAYTVYLEPGEYYLKEVNTPNGYEFVKSWTGPIQVNKGEIAETQIENYKPETATGEKVNQNNVVIKQAGIRLALLENKGEADKLAEALKSDQESVLNDLKDKGNWSTYGISQIAETDASGIFSFKDLNIQKTYYIVEIETTDKYVRNEDVQTVTVKKVDNGYKLYAGDKPFQLVNIEKGQIQVKKVAVLSEQKIALDGVKFGIAWATDQDDASSDTTHEGSFVPYTTGTYSSSVGNGTFISGYLKPGWYILQEQTVPEGIEKPDASKIWRVKVEAGKVNDDYFENAIENKADYGNFYLKKVSAQNQNTKVWAKFDLLKYDDAKGAYESYDKCREVIFKKNKMNVYQSPYLPVGKYRLIEKEVDAGFTVDSTPIDFEIQANKITGMTSDGGIAPLDKYDNNPILVKNNKQGVIEILKEGTLVEGDKKTSLSNISFNLYHKTSNDFVTDAALQKNFVTNLTSDVNGKIKLSNLDAGEYWLEEASVTGSNAANGYVSGKVVKLVVEPGKTATKVYEGSNFDEEKNSFINESTYGRLKIKKVDTYSSDPLNNVLFEVYDNENCNGVVQDILTTDSSGTALTKMLNPGTYYLKEISTPDGYLTSTKIYGPYTITAHQITDKTPDPITNDPAQSIKIKKMDSKTKNEVDATYMKDAKFALYTSKENAEKDATTPDKSLRLQVVGAEQNFTFTNLEPDTTYYIRELVAPDGYTLATTIYEIKTGTKVGDQAVVEQPIKNSPQGSIKLKKVSAWEKADGTTENLPLVNVTFTLAKSNDPTFSKTGTTDKDGYLEFRGLDAGDYTLTETVPEGFSQSQKSYNVKVTEGEQNVELVTNPVVNRPTDGKFIFTKTDPDGGNIAGVENAVFKLSKKKDNSYAVVRDNIKTDSNGYYESEMLTPGTYKLEETTAPKGFAVMDSVEFIITASQITNVSNSASNTLVNEALGNVKITKYSDSYVYNEKDHNKKEPLKGITFTLTKDNNSQAMTTDASGNCVWEGLNPGTYTLTETAVDGYDSTKKTWNVEVKGGQSTVKTYYPDGTNKGEIVNTSNKGIIVIHKVDEDGKALSGAKFQIYDKDGNPLQNQSTLTTDANGYAFSELLEADPDGTTYTVKETKAPDNYSLDKDYYPIEQVVVVKPIQVSEIILDNKEVNKNTSNYVEFTNKPFAFFEKFGINVHKDVKQTDGSFKDTEIPESETKALLTNTQTLEFKINGYAEGKNQIDAKDVVVTDNNIQLWYKDGNDYKVEEKNKKGLQDYVINSITVYPAYAGEAASSSDPVHAKLEYQTSGSDVWQEVVDSADKLKNLQDASEEGITISLADDLKAVHFRLTYTDGTKKNFHAGGVSFKATFNERSSIAYKDVHEIRRVTNDASVTYNYTIKDYEGNDKPVLDTKTSNQVIVNFPLLSDASPVANISIKTDEAKKIYSPGDTVYYTIKATNEGGKNAPDITDPVISFDIPQSCSLLSNYRESGKQFFILYGNEDDAKILDVDPNNIIISEAKRKVIDNKGNLVETDEETTKVTIKFTGLTIKKGSGNNLYVKFAAQIDQAPSVNGLFTPSYLTTLQKRLPSAENPYGKDIEFNVSSGGDVVEDKDLDKVLNSGDIGGEKYAYSGVTIDVNVNNSLYVYKEVKGQYDSTYLNSQNIASTASGGAISYNIVMKNGKSDQPVEKARIVDILPFNGDTMVARTNAGGAVIDRNTTLVKRPTLKSVSVMKLDGISELDASKTPYTIYYCVGSGNDTEITNEWTKSARSNYNRTTELPMMYSNWQSTAWNTGAHQWTTAKPADMSEVSAIGIEVDAGAEKFKENEGFIMHVEMQAPNYATSELSDVMDKLIINSAMGAVKRTGKAENSIDISDTVENDPVKARLTLAKGSIGDYAFFDKNRDGIQDSGDVPVTGLNVTLHTYKTYRKNGEIVKEELEQQRTTTDATGYYLFNELDSNERIDENADKDDPDNYVGGAIYSYQVEFDTPKDESNYSYVPTTRYAGEDREKDSNIEKVELGNGKFTNMTEEIRLKTIHSADGTIKGEDNMSLDAGFKTLGALGDYVWLDYNRNGIQDSNEPGVAGVTVRLYEANEKGAIGKPIAETITDQNGKYLFPGLIEGKYVVEFDISNTNSNGYAPYTFTTPYALGGTSAEEDSNAKLYQGDKIARSEVIDLGYHSVDLSIDAGLTYHSALSGYCFEDKNYNDVQDLGIALPKTVVELYRIGDDGKREKLPYRTTTVGTDGKYFFDDLIEGDYQVKFIFPEGFEAVEPHQGNDTIDSDVSEELDELRNSGYTPIIHIPANSLEEHWDAGAVRYGSIGDYVWEDLNKNGIQDKGETPIPNIPVYLQIRQKGETTWDFYAATETNAYGRYIFEKLKGSEYTGIEYRVVFDLPYDTKLTTPLEGNDIEVDSNALADYINGWGFPTNVITLGYGQHDMTWDAGIIQSSGSVGDYVWFDTNKNGIQDEENTGIAGIRVILERNDSTNLSNSAWEFVAETKTNHAGYYRFDDLQPGYYRVKFYLKGYTVTMPLSGDDAAIDSDGYEKQGNWYITRPFYLEDGGFDMTWDCGVYKGKANAKQPKPMISNPGDSTIIGVNTGDRSQKNLAIVGLSVSIGLLALLLNKKRQFKNK